MKSLVHTLNQQQIEYFKRFRDIHTYNSRTQIIYHGQTPMAAYVILSGCVELKNARDKVLKECTPPILLGFKELTQNLPFKYTAEIHDKSEVIILDRSALLEIAKEMELSDDEFNLIEMVG